MRFLLFLLSVAQLTSIANGTPSLAQTPNNGANSLQARLTSIRLPPGFSISIYANNLKSARQLALSPGGALAVGSRSDSVYLVTSDGKTFTLASDLNTPNGVAFRGQDLYVAEIGRIQVYRGIDTALGRIPFQPPKPELITDKLPKRTHHGARFIRFSPDDWLYVGIGAPCNSCDATGDDPRFGTIIRMKPDGSSQEIFARGIRNTVGFDWNPSTRELWFTDNGRDLLGDNTPPDELNRAIEAGLQFGFPYCHGRAVSDPEFGGQRPCTEFVRPEFELPAHVAALGMRFYNGTRFPKEYQGKIFIAEHGSWNRTTPIGYRISMVDPTAPPSRDREAVYKIFAQGWLQGASPWGRPVDVLPAPDGSLWVSDDFANAVYQIRYTGPPQSPASAVPASDRPVRSKRSKVRSKPGLSR